MCGLKFSKSLRKDYLESIFQSDRGDKNIAAAEEAVRGAPKASGLPCAHFHPSMHLEEVKVSFRRQMISVSLIICSKPD